MDPYATQRPKQVKRKQTNKQTNPHNIEITQSWTFLAII